MTSPDTRPPRSALTLADRRALRAVAAQFFANGAVFASFVPRLPELRDQVDVSVGVLGLLLSVAGVFGLLGSAMAGPLIGRFGSRHVVVAGGIGLAATLPVIGFARSPVVLLVALGLVALLDVLVDVGMNLQGSWISARRHAPVMNRLHGLWSLGTVLGGLTTAWLAGLDVAPKHHLTGAAAVLLLIVLFVGSGMLRVDEHPAHDDARADAGGQSTRGLGPLVALAAAGGCALAIEVTSSDWAAFRLADDFDASAGLAGLAFAAFTVGMTVGRLAGDWAVGRWGSAVLTSRAIALTFVGMAVAGLVPNQWIVLVGYVLAGLGSAPLFPRLYDAAAQLPGRPGAGLGALTAGSRLAALSVPAAVGGLAATSLGVGAATALVSLPIATVLWWLTRSTSEAAASAA